MEHDLWIKKSSCLLDLKSAFTLFSGVQKLTKQKELQMYYAKLSSEALLFLVFCQDKS